MMNRAGYLGQGSHKVDRLCESPGQKAIPRPLPALAKLRFEASWKGRKEILGQRWRKAATAAPNPEKEELWRLCGEDFSIVMEL